MAEQLLDRADVIAVPEQVRRKTVSVRVAARGLCQPGFTGRTISVEPREGEPLDYTKQQRATFKDAYAKRLRKQLIMLVLLFAVMAPLPFIEDGATFFGLSGAVLGPISLVAIVIGWAIFNSRNWRCPACDNYLGRAFNPKHCRRCGIELRG